MIECGNNQMTDLEYAVELVIIVHNIKPSHHELVRNHWKEMAEHMTEERVLGHAIKNIHYRVMKIEQYCA